MEAEGSVSFEAAGMGEKAVGVSQRIPYVQGTREVLWDLCG